MANVEMIGRYHLELDRESLSWFVRDTETNGAMGVVETATKLNELTVVCISLQDQRDTLAAACEATMEALDGLYGAAHNEPIPHDSLTPDRKAAFNRALEMVTAALALVTADTAGGAS